ncbi:synaptic vesicular amine transporter-like [Homarus americanus]|uniref:synaptic vesicular amine transporter-like n=1 Tax=Homarus americanus TaxID=6706 RepID=UPI001C4922C9|nr:synaptic vesicular amine transporter-like [Homarus americanus]
MLRRGVDVAGLKKEVHKLRSSRLAVILLVYFALVLDNMLLTVVVPIIPDYLYQLEHQHMSTNKSSSNNTTAPKAALHTPPPRLPTSLSHHDPASSLHDPASSLHDPASSLHDSASSLHDPASSLHDSASSLHDPASSLHDPASSLHDPASFLHDPASSSSRLQEPPVTTPGAHQQTRQLTFRSKIQEDELPSVSMVKVQPNDKFSGVLYQHNVQDESPSSPLLRVPSKKALVVGAHALYRSRTFRSLPAQASHHRKYPRSNLKKVYSDFMHVRSPWMEIDERVGDSETLVNFQRNRKKERRLSDMGIRDLIKNPLENSFPSSTRLPIQHYQHPEDVSHHLPQDTNTAQDPDTDSGVIPTNRSPPDKLENMSDLQHYPDEMENLPQLMGKIPQSLKHLPSATTSESFLQDSRVFESESHQEEYQRPQPVIEANSSASSTEDLKLPQDIINENGRVGLLFSSKALVQLLVNPLVGPLTAHVGYSLPLVIGTHNLILSALLFAYAQSYTLMFIARSLQGIASSCIAISGMGIIAECYPEDGERGRMQGLVMGGIALGVLLGYPLGSLLYDFTNSKTPPFLVVVALTAVLAIVQLVVLDPRPVPERVVVTTSLLGLVKDPYILVTAGAVMFSTSAMAVLEPCLPIWLTDTLHPQKWQLGTAFIPDSIGYLVGTSCTAGPAFRLGRWRVAVVAMVVVGLAAATVPEAGSMLALAGPHLCLGMGVGTVDAALMPLLAALVDARHVAAYGAVYAIAQAAVALAYFLGPLVGGAIVQEIGFPWLMRCVAILNLCYCPVLFFLKTFDQEMEETQAILMAAPKPHHYTSHITTVVQPRKSSLRYQQLFDDEDD